MVAFLRLRLESLLCSDLCIFFSYVFVFVYFLFIFSLWHEQDCIILTTLLTLLDHQSRAFHPNFIYIYLFGCHCHVQWNRLFSTPGLITNCLHQVLWYFERTIYKQNKNMECWIQQQRLNNLIVQCVHWIMKL